jgi:hypothetical protein
MVQVAVPGERWEIALVTEPDHERRDVGCPEEQKIVSHDFGGGVFNNG